MVCGCRKFGASKYLIYILPQFLLLVAAVWGVELRLFPNVGSNQGTVEIRYNASQPWGTICDDKWDLKDANVICTQLGFQSATRATLNSEFGAVASGPIFLDEVECLGNERSIVDCERLPGWPEGPINPDINCRANHTEDAGVVCFGSTSTIARPEPTVDPQCTPNSRVRLVDGLNSAHGRLEIRQTPTSNWGTVCDDLFGSVDAQVVCTSLCFGPTHAQVLTGSEVPVGTGPILVDDVQCIGNEASLQLCPRSAWGVHNCEHKEDVIMTCTDLSSDPLADLEPDVQCRPNEFEVTFNRTVYPTLLRDYLYVKGEADQCAGRQSNDTFIWLNIPFSTCSSSVDYNDTHIIYRTTVVYNVPSPVGLITRDSAVDIPIYCAIIRTSSVTQINLPIPQTARPQWSEGQFLADMFLFQDQDFKRPVTSYPFNITLGDWLHVGVVLSSEDNDIRLIVPDCWATAYDNASSQPRYPLLEDKCPSDETLTPVQVNETMFAFSLRSFDFIGNYTYVYIHCTVFVCHVDETKTATCDQRCSNTNKRRKRHGQNPYGDAQELEKGPIILLHRSGTDQSEVRELVDVGEAESEVRELAAIGGATGLSQSLISPFCLSIIIGLYLLK